MSKTKCQTITPLFDLLLDGNLAEHQAKIAESHLETCRQCRTAFEAQSANTEFWDSISLIGDDEFDNDSLTTADKEDSRFDDGLASPKRALLDSVRGLLSPSDNPQSAGRIGAYEILGVVGAGGMGIVLKARDRSLDRMVAIKILAPHLAFRESSGVRFEREAKAAAAVKHDGIIPIYSVSNHNGTPYFVMPYESGPSLQARIDDEGPLSIQESLRVAIQVADALTAAHESGLVHRDIKPSNILLAPGTERALLTDFGLAQVADDQSLTMTGVIAGTPAFMSPEQARGEHVDFRTDLFSLGSVLFMMLTGRPPIVDDSTFAVVRRIGADEMPRLRTVRPDLPNWMEELVARLHRHNRDQRFESAASTATALKQCLNYLNDPVKSTLPKALKCETQRKRPNQILFAIGTAIVSIGLIMIAPLALPEQPSKQTQQPESRVHSVPQDRPQSQIVDTFWFESSEENIRNLTNEFEMLANDPHWSLCKEDAHDQTTTRKPK